MALPKSHAVPPAGSTSGARPTRSPPRHGHPSFVSPAGSNDGGEAHSRAARLVPSPVDPLAGAASWRTASPARDAAGVRPRRRDNRKTNTSNSSRQPTSSAIRALGRDKRRRNDPIESLLRSLSRQEGRSPRTPERRPERASAGCACPRPARPAVPPPGRLGRTVPAAARVSRTAPCYSSVTPITCPSGSASRPSTAPGPGLYLGMITLPPSSVARASAASTSATAT
jgi:hypothetical protein